MWRTETMRRASDQSSELTVRADVEIPERKLTLALSLRENFDRGLQASHTVEIWGNPPAASLAGDIAGVPGIVAKESDTALGRPLIGTAVKVLGGHFLIGLSDREANRVHNLQMLKASAWLGIPMVYGNKQRAILVIEKGATGERVFADAFKAWKQ